NSIGPKRGIQVLYFRNPLSEKKYFSLINKKFNGKTFSSLDEALQEKFDSKVILEINTALNPALCFEEGVRQAIRNQLQAIVTAPLSKELIHTSVLSDKGHTDIMRRLINQDQNIYMAFIGKLYSII